MVADDQRTHVKPLLEHRPVQGPETVASVNDHDGLSEHAVRADLDRRPALDDDVVGERAAASDAESGICIVELGSEASAEFDAGANHERPSARHVQTEPRTEVDRTLKHDRGVRIAE
jgi:hypothetical protein